MGIPKNQLFLAKVNDEKRRRLQGTLGEGHDFWLENGWAEPETQGGKVRGLKGPSLQGGGGHKEVQGKGVCSIFQQSLIPDLVQDDQLALRSTQARTLLKSAPERLLNTLNQCQYTSGAQRIFVTYK